MIPVVLILLPTVLLTVFQLLARPDPEYWLVQHTRGFASSDAFDGVTGILPLFSALFGISSLFAAFCTWSRRSEYLIPLGVGPTIAAIVYLFEHGVTDPAWFTIVALLSIGMLVGTPVTGLWIATNKKYKERVQKRFVTSSRTDQQSIPDGLSGQ